MDILGIGPMELLLILIVMLLVFGPDKLPQMGAKLGRAMRDMRKATRAISSEINATRDAITAEAKPITDPLQEMTTAAKSAQSLVSAAKNPGQAIRDSVLKELNPPPPAEGEPAAETGNVIAPPEAQAAVVTATPSVSDTAPELPPAQPAAAEPPALPAAVEPPVPPEAAEPAAEPTAQPDAAERPALPAAVDTDETVNPPRPTGSEPAGEQ
ncbi:MAG: twin-arginine translocase TatA/TatE family subunit [Anaerolineae bacterium]|nr:twin-arginine translocase TatA/TatE family subunit [Anaerolineae bacterium]